MKGALKRMSYLLQYLETYVMPTQLSEIFTRLKFIEETYSSISAPMSSAKEADFSKTSAGLDCEHLQRTINYYQIQIELSFLLHGACLVTGI